MVVHSSMLNPWFYSFFGTLAMAAGQVFGEELYPIMSNTGILIFIITILALMAEVDKDIVATHEVACFLVQVAQKGDQISVTRSRASMEQQNHVEVSGEGSDNRDQFGDEEKTMECLDDTDRRKNSASIRDLAHLDTNVINTRVDNKLNHHEKEKVTVEHSQTCSFVAVDIFVAEKNFEAFDVNDRIHDVELPRVKESNEGNPVSADESSVTFEARSKNEGIRSSSTHEIDISNSEEDGMKPPVDLKSEVETQASVIQNQSRVG